MTPPPPPLLPTWCQLLGFALLNLCHQTLCQTRRCHYHEKPLRKKYYKYGFVNGSEQHCYFTDCCYSFYKIREDDELEVESLSCYLRYNICYPNGCKRHDKRFLVCVCNDDWCNNVTHWTPGEEKPVPLQPYNDVSIVLYGCLMALLLVLCVALTVWRFINKKLKKTYPSLDPLCVPTITSDIVDVELLQALCRGGFATVWEGRHQGVRVAVKVFPQASRLSFSAEREVLQLPLMAHPNIIHYFGSGSIGDTKILVLEYAEHGSLHLFLSSHCSTWTSSLTLCLTLSQGLSHLHQQDVVRPAVAHGDLSSSNVLVKFDGTCALCDFGCSTVIHRQHTREAEGGTGTLRYMSPELLDGSVMLGSSWRLQADVYSLALVLWEVWMRCSDLYGETVPLHLLPYEAELGPGVSADDLRQFIHHSQERPTIPEAWSQHPQGAAVADLLECCWDSDPEARLSASCAVDRLSSFQASSRNTSTLTY